MNWNRLKPGLAFLYLIFMILLTFFLLTKSIPQ